jgi:2-methylisocitrate lyase-like PEP mutase family enzyme
MSTSHADLAARADRLHALHDKPRVLVLPNAWDAVSARVIEEAGFPAIATSSAAVAWTLGRADGEQVSRDEMLAAVERIVRVVRVPVSADLEAGYGDVAGTVRAALAVGAVGMNLEDATASDTTPLLPLAEATQRVREARAAADAAKVRFFVNARTDVFLRQVGEPKDRLRMATERVRAYREAGADGVFVPGVTDAETIGALVHATDAPLNVLARAGLPSVAELGRLGVARVSLGSAAASVVLKKLRGLAASLRDEGTFDGLADGVSYADVNALFSRPG